MSGFSVCQRTSSKAGFFWYNEEKGGERMENWKKDARKEVVFVDLDALVPKDHLL